MLVFLLGSRIHIVFTFSLLLRLRSGIGTVDSSLTVPVEAKGYSLLSLRGSRRQYRGLCNSLPEPNGVLPESFIPGPEVQMVPLDCDPTSLPAGMRRAMYPLDTKSLAILTIFEVQHRVKPRRTTSTLLHTLQCQLPHHIFANSSICMRYSKRQVDQKNMK